MATLAEKRSAYNKAYRERPYVRPYFAAYMRRWRAKTALERWWRGVQEEVDQWERWRDPLEACWDMAKERVKERRGWESENIELRRMWDEKLQEELLAEYEEILKRRPWVRGATKKDQAIVKCLPGGESIAVYELARFLGFGARLCWSGSRVASSRRLTIYAAKGRVGLRFGSREVWWSNFWRTAVDRGFHTGRAFEKSR